MPYFKIAGQPFDLDREPIETCLGAVTPEPIYEHYVVVCGRRYPPKQVISCMTQLDRADFTTHQARRILRRLGFVAARKGEEAAPSEPDGPDGSEGPHGGKQALALQPFVGQWVALSSPTDVLTAAETPQEVLAWLAEHERSASHGMFRVPASVAEAEGVAPS
jgi:hypothetical protein